MNYFEFMEHKRMGHDVKRRWKPGDILLVDAIHMGATLIRRDVLEKLRDSDPDKPFFLDTRGREKHGVSEDFYFCQRLAEIGVKPAVATGIVAHHVSHTYIDGYTGEVEFLE